MFTRFSTVFPRVGARAVLRFFWLVLLASAALFLATVQAQTIPMDKGAFTAYVEKQLRKKNETANIKTDEQPLTIIIDGAHLSLDRLYLVCQTGANQCAATVQHFIAGVAEALNAKHAVLSKKDLRLAVRADNYVAQLGKAAEYLQKRPFMNGFIILAVSDSPATVRPVSVADLPGLQLNSEELFEIARSNTLADLPPLATVAKPAAPGKIATPGFEQYAASRLLFFKEWEELAKAQDGILLVCAPTTSRLLYISESSSLAVRNLRAAARDLMATSPSVLSDVIFKWTPTGWEALP